MGNTVQPLIGVSVGLWRDREDSYNKRHNALNPDSEECDS